MKQQNPRYLYTIGLCICTVWIVSTAYTDIVTLKDGVTLRCQVISDIQSQDTGDRYLKIQVGQSTIWLNRKAVERIDSTPVEDAYSPETEALVQRLLQEGILVPTIKKQLDFISPSKPLREQDVPIIAKNIRGWAYLYENEKALDEGKRAPVMQNASIPTNTILILSPNTKMTLQLPDIGTIGLESGTRVKFNEVTRNRSRKSFTLDLRLNHGRVWFDIQSKERVIFILNSVRCIPQEALFYVETTGKIGAIDITYLKGKTGLKFSRNRTSEAPYLVDAGQVLKVDPGSNRLPVEPSSNLQSIQETIDSWNDWKPEPLDIHLDIFIPPFQTFPSFRSFPALYPYTLTIDESLLLPPETRSLGEILKIYKKALETYKIDTGRYPSFDHGLDALIQSFDVPGWKGPYIPLELPRRDAWGEPFIYDLYTVKGQKYVDVRSKGQNRKDDKGLEDDIR